jgi:RNA polymerase sigma-70 factor (ECF subfamily)
MPDLNSSQLLGGFHRRENDALDLIYKRNQHYVFDLVHTLVQGASETEDLAAEVFLVLFESHARFRNLDAIRSFLHSSARNICTKFLARRQTARKKRSALIYEQPAVSQDMEESERQAAWRSQILQAVNQLPERTSQVIKLHFLEELPNRAIAQKLGMSVKSVANHKTSGLKALKELIGKQGLYALLILFLFR